MDAKTWKKNRVEQYRKVSESHMGKKHSLESRVRMMVSQRKRWARARGEDESQIRYEDVYQEFVNSEKYQMMIGFEAGGKRRMSLKEALRYAKTNNGVKMDIECFIVGGCDA